MNTDMRGEIGACPFRTFGKIKIEKKRKHVEY
jgi:hypothetical protein